VRLESLGREYNLKTIIRLFVIGAMTHVVFWVAVINYYAERRFAFVCSETSCWVLLITDFPAMIFASDGSVETLSKLSLIFGTLWWGIIFMVFGSGLSALIRWAEKTSHKETIQDNKERTKGYLTCASCEKTFYAEDCPGVICPDCKGELKP
jgi:hypothetical protein